ncbi:MAG: DUF262 domain-containing protein [Pseudonocardiaceae bacterium]
MTEADLRVREELFENVPTGVEIEQLEGDPDERPPAEVPWSTEHIRVSTKTFSLRNVIDLIEQDDLELAPDFQRYRVWSIQQKSRLIESILLQIPLPAFYFAEDSEGMMHIVDGLQRISTVADFVDNKFSLKGMEYLDNIRGKYFNELPHPMRRRIHNAQIVVHVIDPKTPAGIKYDIFKRINTGGTPLNHQEIRHCMSKQRSRDFLKRCTHLPEFDLATGGKLQDHVRMNDREMALRFCAFSLLGEDAYFEPRFRAMDPFLEHTTELLDDEREIPDTQLDELAERFRLAMVNAYAIFDDHAFRKWPYGTEWLSPINRPLFETWSIVLSRYETTDVAARRKDILATAREWMTNDQDYIAAITSSTGDPRKVRYRFARTTAAAEAGW